MQKFKKLIYSVLTCTFLLNVNIPANSTEKEVKFIQEDITPLIEVFIKNLQKKPVSKCD